MRALLLTLLLAIAVSVVAQSRGPASIVIPGPYCGDGAVNGDEECDASAASPGCAGCAACRCPVPTTTSSTATTSSSNTSSTATTSSTVVGATTTTTTIGSGAYFVSPSGSNSNNGMSGSPWATLEYAVSPSNPNRLGPGDTVVLTNGMHAWTRIQCGDVDPKTNAGVCNGKGANARCGTPSQPITIMAQNEGQAHIAANGSTPAFFMQGCANYVIVGLYGSSQDNTGFTEGDYSTFSIKKSTRITFRRNLANRNNRCSNSHVVQFNSVTDSLIEENEIWRSSRHHLSISGASAFNTVRRNFIQNAGVGPSTVAACLNNGRPRGGPGDSHIAAYPCFGCTFENNVAAGPAGGFSNNAGYGFWSGGCASCNNKWRGNIAIGVDLCSKIFSRPSDPRGVANLSVEDFLCVNPRGYGIRHSVARETVLRRIGIVGGGVLGVPAFAIDDPGYDSNDQLDCRSMTGGPCRASLIDSIIYDNGVGGVNVTAAIPSGQQFCTLTRVTAAASGSNFQGLAASCAGSGANQCACTGKSTTAPDLWGITGTRCPTFCPDGDTACDGTGESGGDRAPEMRCRFQGGVRLSGPSANVFATSGTTTCSGTTPPGSVSPCAGGLNFCLTVVAGVNDGPGDCRKIAHEELNHKANGTGCPLAELACP